MQPISHKSVGTLRQRISRSTKYERLSKEEEQNLQNSASLPPHQNLHKDSVQVVNENKSPTLLSHVTEECIAFGMVHPKIPKSELNSDLSMKWVLGSAVDHNYTSDSSFHKASGFYHCQERKLGMSAIRDKTDVVFRIYELPETSEHLKVFDGYDYDRTVRKMRTSLRAVYPNHDVIDCKGNVNSEGFSVIEIYDKKLQEAKDRAHAERLKKSLEDFEASKNLVSNSTEIPLSIFSRAM